MLYALDFDGITSFGPDRVAEAVAFARSVVDNPGDRLLYITSRSVADTRSQLETFGFPEVESVAYCDSHANKLKTAILTSAPEERIAFIGTRLVLEETDMDSIYREYPQAASLVSRLTFILFSVAEVPADAYKFAEFPIEAWTPNIS
jgi:ribonucleotide monophosphatase NagD (HAD superfamily)